ncbi:hypothetical protein ACFQ0M_07660 [Kitasatospora aburaviensis]
MTDGLTVDEALRALAALEAAWKDDDEALTALAAGGRANGRCRPWSRRTASTPSTP